MPTLRLALAQVNSTVGDMPGNARRVRKWTARAARAGAHMVAFPEMMLTGYPVEDLVFRESFVAASKTALTQLARDLAADGLGEVAVVVGYVDADGPAKLSSDASPMRGPRDAVALLHGGEVVARYAKHHLPNYGVFDEDRYFIPGNVLRVVRFGGIDVALTICEDIWQAGGPFAVARQAQVGLVLNVNASPYERNKDDVRLSLVARRAREADCTVAYVNLIGGQDELVYDGDSLIVDGNGALLTRAPQFAEHLLVHDLDLPLGPAGPLDPVGLARPAGSATPALDIDDEIDTDAPALRIDEMRVERVYLSDALPEPGPESVPELVPELGPELVPELVPELGPERAPDPGRAVGGVAERLVDEAEVWQALVLGLRDYVRKNGFPSVILGLSGGIDSSVVAAIACDALGPSNVAGVSMPSGHSSAHSRDDAADLAKRTGLDFRVVPIQPMVDAFMSTMDLTGLAVENLQARVRGVLLMALSNQEGHLVLTTGNKSELAVGYSTLYGDSVGGFNPLKDVPKTLVWKLAIWRNEESTRRGEQQPIPESSITKAPSAELRPGQLDSDSLPEYALLDAILYGYIDADLGREGLIAAGHDPVLVDKVVRMVDLAEYKRRQSAPGTKISFKAFGRDRRLPITNRFREAAIPAPGPTRDPVRS